MRAHSIEYRFRFLLHGLIFWLGFWAPWAEPMGLTTKSTWLTLSSLMARAQWLTFFAATQAVLVAALVFLVLGAWFRVWGSAFVGADVVASRNMHSRTLLADGPYRRTRNPLYLGTLLHAVGISILMPPSGALFAIALVWLLQVRLALAEEPFLEAQFGQPYVEYRNAVPRFLPSPAPMVPAAGQSPRWLQALLGEFYFVAIVFVMGIWGWQFNAMPLKRGLLICLGVWLIIYALMPRAKATEVAQAS